VTLVDLRATFVVPVLLATFVGCGHLALLSVRMMDALLVISLVQMRNAPPATVHADVPLLATFLSFEIDLLMTYRVFAIAHLEPCPVFLNDLPVMLDPRLICELFVVTRSWVVCRVPCPCWQLLPLHLTFLEPGLQFPTSSEDDLSFRKGTPLEI
jgi:hypothetical protein